MIRIAALPETHVLRVLLALMLAAFAALPAATQAAAPGGHGWVVLATDASDAVLFHLPPRATSPSGLAGAPEGSLRRVTSLAEPPLALAATGQTAYMAFGRLADARARQSSLPGPRRVLSISATREHDASLWVYNAIGRLTNHPAIPPQGDLVGMAATPAGLVALLHDEPMPGTHGQGRLFVLALDAWREVPLPPGLVITPNARIKVMPHPDGVAVACWNLPDRLELFLGSLDRRVTHPPAADGPVDPLTPLPRPEVAISALWTVVRLASPSADNLLDAWWIGGGLVSAVEAESGALTLYRHGSRDVRALATLEGLDARPAFAPLHDVDRIAVVWVDTSSRSGTTPRIIELSAISGRVWYDGPGRLSGPLSDVELRSLALLMLAGVALVFVFLFRNAGADRTITIPPGTALMPPLPRLLAFVIDVLLAGWITSLLLGVPTSEILTTRALTSQVENPWGLPVMLLVGALGSTVLESWRGRTPGKWLFGGGVTRIDGSGRVPTLAGSLIRNLCKWLVPPLALAGLFDPNLRHRGDALAGTIVVVGIHPPEQPEDASRPTKDDEHPPSRG
ncbi:MAG: RDD family protein [Phycisphaeraceae bacterium]|nr:RDD family protein [Phycisphaeraceae bacterium]